MAVYTVWGFIYINQTKGSRCKDDCLAGQKIWTRIPTFRTLFVINSQIGEKVEIQIRFGQFTSIHPNSLSFSQREKIQPVLDMI